jgi:hypothetical protein
MKWTNIAATTGASKLAQALCSPPPLRPNGKPQQGGKKLSPTPVMYEKVDDSPRETLVAIKIGSFYQIMSFARLNLACFIAHVIHVSPIIVPTSNHIIFHTFSPLPPMCTWQLYQKALQNLSSSPLEVFRLYRPQSAVMVPSHQQHLDPHLQVGHRPYSKP